MTLPPSLYIRSASTNRQRWCACGGLPFLLLLLLLLLVGRRALSSLHLEPSTAGRVDIIGFDRERSAPADAVMNVLGAAVVAAVAVVVAFDVAVFEKT
jgi:hypothetical protein